MSRLVAVLIFFVCFPAHAENQQLGDDLETSSSLIKAKTQQELCISIPAGKQLLAFGLHVALAVPTEKCGPKQSNFKSCPSNGEGSCELSTVSLKNFKRTGDTYCITYINSGRLDACGLLLLRHN